jgi:prophage regulatory protein
MKLLRIKELIQVTGLSRMNIYRLERSGRFPKRRRLGQHFVAWLEGDVAR